VLLMMVMKHKLWWGISMHLRYYIYILMCIYAHMYTM
jgi:hypothetical protein